MHPKPETPKNTQSNWDPFPEPRTIPEGWDLSEYLAHAEKGPTKSLEEEPKDKLTLQ